MYKSKFAYLLFLPTLILIGLFIYNPIFTVITTSFYRINYITNNSKFVGLAYFKELLAGARAAQYWQVFGQTLGYAVIITTLSIVIAFLLAYQLSKPLKIIRWLRLGFLWPFAVSPALIGTIFLFCFNNHGGIMAMAINRIFQTQIYWFNSAGGVWILLILATLWKTISFNLFFYLTAFYDIDNDVIKAAYLDGADASIVLRKIVLPLFKPITFFLIFLNINYTLFDSFSTLEILTKGGPYLGGYPEGLTTMLIYKIYKDGFMGLGALGLAAAQSVLLTILAASIAMAQFFIHKKNYRLKGLI